MANPKVIWARHELSKRLKGKKTKSEKTKVFKQVWAEAARKYD
jgi:hypothetical protein